MNMASLKSSVIKIENICRTCLSKENELHPLYDAANGKNSLDYIVSEITGLKMCKSDGLPTTICSNCKEKAESAFDFKMDTHKADKSLQGRLKEIKNLDVKVCKADDIGVKTENLPHDDDDYMDDNFSLSLSNAQEGISGLTLDVVKTESQNKSSTSYIECKNCLLVFESQNQLEDHSKNKCIKVEYEDSNGSYCPICGICYEGAENLSKHIREYHSEIMGPKKRGRPKKLLTSTILNKLSENGFYITSVGAKNYECTFCKKNLKTKEEFIIHILDHKDTKVICCILCKKMYLKKKYFDQHNCIEESTGGNKLQNEDSSVIHNNLNKEKCSSNVLLMQNILDPNCDMKNINIPHVCSACSRLFLSEGDLICHHDAEHPELSLKCSLCTKVFASVKSAARHRTVCKEIERKHKCNTCGLKFAYEISLNKHILRYHEGQSVSVKFIDPKTRLDERQFQCDICNRSFNKKELLVRHTKIHMPNEKYYECDVCEKKFHRSDNLRSHKRIHDENRGKSNAKNCLCSFCGRSFSNSSNLIVHMRRHTGEKPYKCDFCDKGFPRSSDLQCHRRSHTGEKPCICSICRKGFSRSNKLSRHMRVHTGQRPYKCTYCDKAFAQSNDLTLHIRRHTGDRPYICEVCGDRFIQGTALQYHIRSRGHVPLFLSDGTRLEQIPFAVPNTVQ